MSGANYIHDIAGLLEADLTVAYDKLVLDNEILGMCQRVLRGIEVTEETLAAELMIDKGPGGHYVGEQHTRRHMRGEFFMPRLSTREKRERAAEGSDALSRARAWVARVRAEPRESRLDPALRWRVLEAFPAIRQP
jgi:trimethylamine--corrinoid protein Co-methyltransferase